MKEIEILFRLNESKGAVFEKLKKLKSIGEKRVIDEYYSDDSELFKPDSKGNILNWFRIRQAKDKTFVTFKKDNIKENGDWLYSDEYETEVSDYETAKKIFTSLGLKPLIIIDNTKYIFLKNDFELVVEDVNDLGLFLEVEILDAKDDADISAERKRILEFVESLNLKIGEELNIGKPEMMLKKRTS